MRTNTMANHEYRPHPPIQFLTIALQNVCKCDPFRFSPPISYSKLPMMSIKLSPSLASSVRLSLASTSSNALLTHSSPSLTTTSKSGTNCKLGTTLLSGTPSLIASSRSSLATFPPKGDVIPTSSSVASFVLKNERRG